MSEAGATVRTEDRFIADALGRGTKTFENTRDGKTNARHGDSPTPSIQSMANSSAMADLFGAAGPAEGMGTFGGPTAKRSTQFGMPNTGAHPGAPSFSNHGSDTESDGVNVPPHNQGDAMHERPNINNVTDTSRVHDSHPNQHTNSWNSDTYESKTDKIREDSQKRAIFHELQSVDPEIISRYGLSVQNTSLQTLQYELDRYHSESQLRSQIELLEVGLSFFCYSIEMINTKFLNRVLAIEGWARATSTNMGKFRGTLRKIAIKYFRRNESNEFVELGMLLLGSLAVYHFQNTHGHGLRGMFSRSSKSTRAKRRTSSRRRENYGPSNVPSDDEDDQIDLSEASSESSDDDGEEELAQDNDEPSNPSSTQPSTSPGISAQGMMKSFVNAISPGASLNE